MKSDSQWIQETLAGNSAAFGELIRKYEGRLYQTALHITGDSSNALDAVQEAFICAYLKLSAFRAESSFYTWLYRIAVRAALDLRRRRTEQLEPMGSDEEWELIAPTSNPQMPLLQKERDELVQRAISRLPTEQRVVLVMREMDGLCYETIAEMLELPVGTVRSRLHRARLQLRELLIPILELEDEHFRSS
ncbi:MAG: sigma-70 family RNA polymerase sigma factor [Thermoguttaceae bacterium]|nr:sigma-70 family RNA polymerase sigma factor [Thermoguttaceae bacterium]